MEETADNGGGSDSSGGLIAGVMGGVMGVMALIIAGLLYQRHKNNKRARQAAFDIQGTNHRDTMAMTTNPAFVTEANRCSTGDGYLEVAEYEIAASAVSGNDGRVILDTGQYVADDVAVEDRAEGPAVVLQESGGTMYAVPMAGSNATDGAYSLFRSAGPAGSKTGSSTTDPNADGAYRVFRSPDATSSAS